MQVVVIALNLCLSGFEQRQISKNTFLVAECIFIFNKNNTVSVIKNLLFICMNLFFDIVIRILVETC
jgi:hypothetical protein